MDSFLCSSIVRLKLFTCIRTRVDLLVCMTMTTCAMLLNALRTLQGNPTGQVACLCGVDILLSQADPGDIEHQRLDDQPAAQKGGISSQKGREGARG